MAQYINMSTQITKSLATGPSYLYAVVNNSGSSVVKIFDGKVNPLAPLDGKFTSSIGATTGSALPICIIGFNGTPIKVDYGVRATYGLIVAKDTDVGDVTIIYE